MNDNNKYLIIGLVLVLVASVVAGIFLIKPTVQPVTTTTENRGLLSSIFSDASGVAPKNPDKLKLLMV